MARVEIDYRRELHWPSVVDIGTRLISVGRSSYAMGQGIFRGDLCVTTGRTTLVMIDRSTRRPAELPASYRAVLEGLLAEK
jgi:acyl-CoA thioester hydrolase